MINMRAMPPKHFHGVSLISLQVRAHQSRLCRGRDPGGPLTSYIPVATHSGEVQRSAQVLKGPPTLWGSNIGFGL
jgi:hypothetical protein